MADTGTQVELDVRGVGAPRVRPEPPLAGEPLVEVLAHLHPCGLDVAASVDLVEGFGQSLLGLALRGEAALGGLLTSTAGRCRQLVDVRPGTVLLAAVDLATVLVPDRAAWTPL